MSRASNKRRKTRALAVRTDAVRERDTLDDWGSTTSSLGSIRDKHVGINHVGRVRMNRRELDSIYTYQPLIAREIDLPATDALREGWEIKNIKGKGPLPSPKLVKKWCEEIRLDPSLIRSQKWKAHYGGSLIVMSVGDGCDPSDPLCIGPGRKTAPMFPLRVLMADHAEPGDTDADFKSPTYLDTLFYKVQGLITTEQKVHASRTIPFEAIELSTETLLETTHNGWGPSVIERMFASLSADGAAGSHAISMMYISSVLHIGLDGFRKKFATKGGPEQIQRWLGGVQNRLESMGLVALDSNDKIGNLSLQVAGMDALLTTMRERLAASSSQPREIFLNESANGLRGGELSGPQEIWNKKVMSLQTRELTPAINRILKVLFLSKGLGVESWDIEWAPLWVRSEESAAKIRDSNAKSDTAYVLMAAASGDEVRDHRLIKGDDGQLSVEGDDGDDDGEVMTLDLSTPPTAAEVAAEVAATAATPAPDPAAPGAPPTAEPTAEPAAPVGDPAAAAGLMAIVEKVTSGAIPYASGVAIIQATFPTFASMAAQIMGPAPAAVAPVVDAPIAQTRTPPTDLVTPRDAAKSVGVSTRAITMAIAQGVLPFWGIGSNVRVSMNDLSTALKSHEPAAPAPVPPV